MLLSVLKIVFSNARYTRLAALSAVVVFTLALWLPNFSFVMSYLTSAESAWQKLQFIWSFYGSVQTNHTLYSAAVSLLIAVLSGINIALLAYYTRRVRVATKGFKRLHAGSYVGLVIGFLGVGCAACGSVILTAILATIGVGGLLLALPFKGAELGIIALGILFWSNYYLAKKINDPLVCHS
jgi:hypothetical protein